MKERFVADLASLSPSESWKMLRIRRFVPRRCWQNFHLAILEMQCHHDAEQAVGL